MGVASSRVAVVGGSIAGCAAALALHRAGVRVTVIERGTGELAVRGLGIGVPERTWRAFVAAGYLDPDTPALPCRERPWIVSDPAGGPWGRVVWRQPTALLAARWGAVWRTLWSRVREDVEWRAGTVTAVLGADDGAEVVMSGDTRRFDAVVGADGYRSAIRPLVAAAAPRYTGYALWRGSVPITRVPEAREHLEDRGPTLAYRGGHGVAYLIPGPDGEPPRVNWALYHGRPAADAAPRSLSPGSLGAARSDELFAFADAHLPSAWADIVARTRREELALQPVYDVVVPRYARGRILLAGDAGALARPHSTAGVSKALGDAMALERLCTTGAPWDSVVEAYDGERTEEAAGVVALAARLGDAQVTHAPDWSGMSPTDFERWHAASVTPRPSPGRG